VGVGAVDSLLGSIQIVDAAAYRPYSCGHTNFGISISAITTTCCPNNITIVADAQNE